MLGVRLDPLNARFRNYDDASSRCLIDPLTSGPLCRRGDRGESLFKIMTLSPLGERVARKGRVRGS